MSDTTSSFNSAPMRIRARGRSFLALVLSPEAPLTQWIAGVDLQITRSSELFRGKPVILDLSLISEDTPHLSTLLDELTQRGVRVISIEGGNKNWQAVASWDWPDSLSGGKASGEIELPDPNNPSDSLPLAQTTSPSAPSNEPMFIDGAIRSGQSIQNMHGDIIILGAVSSGAELIAAGSIHVYGPLRGRAIAGVGGISGARIFATKMEAELLALDGYYAVAEDINPTIFGKPAQALLLSDRIQILPLPH